MSNLDEDRIIGALGIVTTRIPGGERPGEVQIELRGGSAAFIGYADASIDRNQQVLVIGRRPGRGVDVMLFND